MNTVNTLQKAEAEVVASDDLTVVVEGVRGVDWAS